MTSGDRPHEAPWFSPPPPPGRLRRIVLLASLGILVGSGVVVFLIAHALALSAGAAGGCGGG